MESTENLKNNQFVKGDLAFDKDNNKVIIYKILTEKKLEVCKIIIDEKNNKIKIATKTNIVDESEIEINYSFALEYDTAQYILKLIYDMKMQWNIEYSHHANKEEEYYLDKNGVVKKRKKHNFGL